jgi:hypothetical protein
MKNKPTYHWERNPETDPVNASNLLVDKVAKAILKMILKPQNTQR